MAQLIHTKTKQVLAQNVMIATHFLHRLKGLMGKTDLAPSDTLWIIPCTRGVHTFFMHFPLDLIFVDRFLTVTYVYQNIKPGKIIKPPGSFALTPPSYSVFEFSAPADWGGHSTANPISDRDSNLKIAGRKKQSIATPKRAIQIQKGDQLYVGD